MIESDGYALSRLLSYIEGESASAILAVAAAETGVPRLNTEHPLACCEPVHVELAVYRGLLWTSGIRTGSLDTAIGEPAQNGLIQQLHQPALHLKHAYRSGIGRTDDLRFPA